MSGKRTLPIDSQNDQIIRWLLGNLPQAEREELERRVSEDCDYAELVEATEEELIDRYATGALPPSDQQRFEHYYLTTKERHRKLEFARAFLKSASQGTSFAKSLLKVAALLLVGFFLGWLCFRSPEPIVTLALRPGNVRGAEQAATLEIPIGTVAIDFQLYPDSRTEVDTASLLTASLQREIERQQVNVSPDGSVRYRVAASLIPPGEYIISLERTGQVTARFLFTITTK